MTRLLLFNKPYGVVCQFSPDQLHPTLKDFISIPGVYAAGRLDTDSEGLLLLTDDGRLQHRLSDPHYHKNKTYWVQVEGCVSEQALEILRRGVDLQEFTTLPAKVMSIDEPPHLWPRTPPIRFRKTVPTAWLEITIQEGKNRQVRRMTAKVGLPTLRLIRCRIDRWSVAGLQPGEWREEIVSK